MDNKATNPYFKEEVANLGLATTEALLAELRSRIDVDYLNGGGGLYYSTVTGRPDSNEGHQGWSGVAEASTFIDNFEASNAQIARAIFNKEKN